MWGEDLSLERTFVGSGLSIFPNFFFFFFVGVAQLEPLLCLSGWLARIACLEWGFGV